MKIDILGTEYEISFKTREDDSLLERCDGYTDKTVKKIVVSSKEDDCELADFAWYQKKVLRHEIIHAFLLESGLQENFTHPEYGHDENFIDWIAVQFPKILKAFKAADAL